MKNLKELVIDLNEKIFDSCRDQDNYFYYVTDGYNDMIKLDMELANFQLFYDDMEREFDEEKNDCAYTPKEEIINQLKKYRDNLDVLIEVLDSIPMLTKREISW